jgi:hypothetical protein
MNTHTRVISEFNLAPKAGATMLFDLGDYTDYRALSVQVDWLGLTGTLDATAKLKQTNSREVAFSEIPSLNFAMSAAAGNQILETFEFSGRFVALDVTMNGCTGGTISVSVTAKK